MDIKKYKSYIFTGNKTTCSGCGACVQVCKRKALSMQADEEGFLYPVMDVGKCVHCGLCDSRCPEIKDKSNSVSSFQHCYIATTKDDKYYKESASIGICTMLAEYFLQKGGVVYGCFLDEGSWTSCHIRLDDIKDISKIRNSKYLQSNTQLTFKQVQTDLLNGTLVLYTGTPCQIAGLKTFLNKDFDDLYTVDIICHGVFSPMLMPLEVKYWTKLFGAEIRNFRFRSKRVYKHSNGGMVNFDLYKNGKFKRHVERYAASSPSYFCYAYSGNGINYNLRLSCYSCKFKEQTRYGDITVGDPWGIDDSDKNGVKLTEDLTSRNSIRSLYSSNTQKGNMLLKEINQKLVFQEIPVEKAFVQAAVNYGEREIPQLREILFSSLKEKEYGKLVEYLFKCDLEKNHKKFKIRYWKSEVKKIIKRVLFFK